MNLVASMLFTVPPVFKGGITLVTVTITSVCRFKDMIGSCTLQLSAVISLLSYYASQKKTFEINPRHPLIKDMLRRVKVNK